MAPLNVTRYGFSQPQTLGRRTAQTSRPMQRNVASYGATPSRSSVVDTTGFRVGGVQGDFNVGGMNVPRSASYVQAPPPGQTAQNQQTANTAATAGQQATYEADPILEKIRALGRSDVATARAQAEAGRKKLLLDYGDEGFARTTLAHSFGGGDQPVDDAVLQAIRENPYSILKQQQRDQETSTREAEESFNKANLFYGGARVKGLGDLSQSFLQRGADARGAVSGQLDSIEQALMDAERAAAQAEFDYITNAQYNGGDGEPPPDDSGAYGSPLLGRLATGLAQPRKPTSLTGWLDYGLSNPENDQSFLTPQQGWRRRRR